MPKKINSVLLNKSSVNLISDFCKRNDISEAAFSRKFGKNNRWISDLRRGKNLSLPDAEEAARMCILLETTPEEILLHEGETDEETAKCLEDIQRVKELVAELRKEEPVLIGASLPITREAWEAEAEKWSDEDLLKAMRKLLAIQEERREKNGD